MQQITAPLADLPDDPVAAAANPEFPIVLRGYDRAAVEAYVNSVTQLVAELYATRSPEGAVRRALERVGGEVSAILQRAHETAEQITMQSRMEAEERLSQAREEADALERSSRQRARATEQDAQRRVEELDAEVDRIWAERDRIVGDVRRLSEELGTLAGAAATRFPPEPSAEGAPVEDERLEEPQDADARGSLTDDEPPIDEGRATEALPGAPRSFTPPTPAEPPEPFQASRSAGMREPEPFGAGEPFEVVEYVGKAQPIRKSEPEEKKSAAADADLGGAAIEPEEPLGPVEPGQAAEGTAIEQPLEAEEAEALAAQETAHLPVEAAADAPVSDEQAAAAPVADEQALFEQPTMVHEPVARRLSPDARLIDLMHLGRERVIGCWQAEDVLIDPGPSSCLETLLGALGGQRPRALLLTHIHLDHAGASGALVELWPELEVYVHERGAPHLMDPSRLLESARRLYGEDMDRLWGEVRPVPVQNVRLLRGDERLLGGAFEVAYTPGHASHHVSYLHGGTAFIGDTGGVRITPETLTIPPTPPPDIDVEAWHQSINRVLAWTPRRLAITHFGSSEDVAAQLIELAERLDNLAALARTEDEETFIATVREEIERSAGPELLPTYVQAAPPEQIYAGLKRYWEKRVEADDSPDSAPAEASTHAGRFPRGGDR